ncbi:MAG: hypothetical protein KDB07_08890, partial [Planctomycetes bacterium]|nr:hypothetical protein [Planctomycetota bacterium]
MKILGIHDGQNASAALVVDGRLVRFGLEARYRRSGEYAGFPRRVIRRILNEEKLSGDDIDAIAFSGHVVKTPRTMRDYLKQFGDTSAIGGVAKTALSYIVPGAFRSEWRKKDRLEPLARSGLSSAKATFIDSHLAASMLAYNSGVGIHRRSLILCAGAGNDRMAATVHVAQNGRLERIATIHEDDSLLNMFEHVTYMLGMIPTRDEQQVMDLGARAHGPRVESTQKRFELLFQFDPHLPLNWQRAANLPDTARCQEFLRNHFRRRRFDTIAGAWHRFLSEFVREWVRRCAHKTEIRDIVLCGDLFELGELMAAASDLREVVSLSRSPLPGSAGNAIGAALLVARDR